MNAKRDAILECHGNLTNLPKLSLEEGDHAAEDSKAQKVVDHECGRMAFQEEEIRYIGSESKRPCEPRADYNLSQLHMQKSALLGS